MKFFFTLALTASFTISSLLVAQAATVQLKCTVDSIDGSTVIMDCGKNASKLNKTDKVIIKPKNKNNGSCG